MTKLTELETKVLAILKQNADDISGGDFAIMEEVDVRSLSLNRQQLGGVVSSLDQKKVIRIDVTYVNNRQRVTRVTFN